MMVACSPFLPLILLLLLLCGCEATEMTRSRSYRVELFKRRVSTVPFEENDGTVRQRVVHSYRIPSLVDVDGVLVAIADARYDSSNDNSFIETVVKFSVDNGETWETQIAIKNSRVSKISRVVDPTVIVKGNKLFVLVGRFNTSNKYWTQHADGSDWEPLLAVGEVKKSVVNGVTSATITWSRPVSLKPIFPPQIAGANSKQFLGGVGTAITVTDGTLVFPLQVTNMKKNIVAMIMYSEDDGKTWHFAKGTTVSGCSEPSILEWEGKLIMSVRLDIGYRYVYESSDMGETWTEALGTLSRVWGNSPSRKGPGSQSSFIPVTIEGRRVMLFTHPLNYKGRWERDRLHLWVTDNNRIFDVGQISVGDENAAYSSLLYIDDKLLCLHEINHNEVYSLVFAHLINELALIKSVVRTWMDYDTYLSGLCTPADPPSSGGSNAACGSAIPTAGLVGFLFNETSEGHWMDAYRCVHADVVNAEKVANGVQFKGHGAGALWPVSKQGQNRRYQFANHKFTLVATVSIDELPKYNTIPLLGVSLDRSGSRKLLGLAYGDDKRWRPTYGSAPVSPTGVWELKRTYSVALTLQDGVGSVYVNGELLGKPQRVVASTADSIDISHFYIGAYSEGGTTLESCVTVKNVLLYNRQLDPNEITTLCLGKDIIGAEEAGSLQPPDISISSFSPSMSSFSPSASSFSPSMSSFSPSTSSFSPSMSSFSPSASSFSPSVSSFSPSASSFSPSVSSFSPSASSFSSPASSSSEPQYTNTSTSPTSPDTDVSLAPSDKRHYLGTFVQVLFFILSVVFYY